MVTKVFSQYVVDTWHPTLNGSKTLDDFNVGSHDSVWWLGECGHEWENPIRYHVKGSPCHYCSNRKILIGFNDLAFLFPQIAKEWDYSKNGDLVPTGFVKGANAKAWWRCLQGHTWRAKICDRTLYAAPCPYCSGQKVLAGFNDLATTNPNLASEWHPTKNPSVSPTEVSYGSKQIVYWLGKCNHEWPAEINSRQEKGCPFCSNTRVLSGFNDFATTHPDLFKEWHPTKNTLDPTQVLAGHNAKVWWFGTCSHEWEAKLVVRAISGHGCHFCSNSKVLVGFNDLLSCFPEIANEWHPKLNVLSAADISKSSTKIAWWLGKECGHTWDATVTERTGQQYGCPICSSHRLLGGFNDLATLFPEIALEWHPTKNGDLKPSQVMSKTDTVVWWLGKSCDHTWDVSVGERTGGKLSGCPYCSSRRVLVGFNDFESNFMDIAIQWHPVLNGSKKPSEFTRASGQVGWWQCPKNHKHVWPATFSSRSIGNNCPRCSNQISKPEKIIAALFLDWGFEVERNNRKLLGKRRELDIYIPAQQFAIEYNGTYWHSTERKGMMAHHDKWRICNDLGIELIQIWEDQWLRNSAAMELSLQRKLLPTKTENNYVVVELGEAEALAFLQLTNVSESVVASNYFGAYNESDELTAVMAIEIEPLGSHVVAFEALVDEERNFPVLLNHGMSTLNLNAVDMYSDNSFSCESLLDSAGFVLSERFEPEIIARAKSPQSKTKAGGTRATTDVWSAGKSLWVNSVAGIQNEIL